MSFILGRSTHANYLCPDTKVVIGNEWRRFVGRSVSHSKRVDMAENDDGDAHKKEALLPHLPAIYG